MIKKRFLALQGLEIVFAREALNETSEKQMDLVAAQLAQGIKSDGSRANFTYTPTTIAIKKNRSGLASETRWLTNYDTGESYRKMFMIAKSDRVEFGTTTDKEADIEDRMDGKAFRPTDESKREYITNFAMPVFLSKIRGFIKL